MFVFIVDGQINAGVGILRLLLGGDRICKIQVILSNPCDSGKYLLRMFHCRTPRQCSIVRSRGAVLCRDKMPRPVRIGSFSLRWGCGEAPAQYFSMCPGAHARCAQVGRRTGGRHAHYPCGASREALRPNIEPSRHYTLHTRGHGLCECAIVHDKVNVHLPLVLPKSTCSSRGRGGIVARLCSRLMCQSRGGPGASSVPNRCVPPSAWKRIVLYAR